MRPLRKYWIRLILYSELVTCPIDILTEDRRSSTAVTLKKDIGFHPFNSAYIILVTGHVKLLDFKFDLRDMELNMVCVEGWL